jgi:hypothetical protein
MAIAIRQPGVLVMLKTGLIAAALSGLLATAGSAAVIHDDGATNFTGQYRGVGSFDVNFNAVGGLSAISFDIFGANSVDGFGNGWDDLFTVTLNGADILTGYFNMSGGGTSIYTSTLLTALTTTNPGGNFAGGFTAVSGAVTLLSGLNILTFAFTSPGANNGGNQGTGDESWAINGLDVELAAVPLPAAGLLLLAALGGLAAARRRGTAAAA